MAWNAVGGGLSLAVASHALAFATGYVDGDADDHAAHLSLAASCAPSLTHRALRAALVGTCLLGAALITDVALRWLAPDPTSAPVLWFLSFGAIAGTALALTRTR